MSTNWHESSINTFFALIRAGLWEDVGANLDLNLSGKIDWEKVYQLAEEQSVVGLVLAGIEQFKKANVKLALNQELLLQLIGEVQMIEQTNKSMNEFLEKLMKKFKCEGIDAVVVKGQGVAQCYEKPLWRASGDIDLLLDDISFFKAQRYLSKIASDSEGELKEEKHHEFEIGQWIVELHGNMPTHFSKRTDKLLEKIQKDAFRDGYFRTWRCNETDIKLLGIDADILFVFTHILKHFFRGGIGIRQICDWSRLIWKNRGKIDKPLLEQRLKQMGLMTEWKAFAALAVNVLGFPSKDMPFYSISSKWSQRSSKIINFILRTGNFGHNRNTAYYNKYPYLVTKFISFYWRFADNLRYVLIFPLDSIRVTMWLLRHGLKNL